MKVRVYIATTEGPVAIQRLAAEDPEVRSVVCLNGTSEALPISPAYDAFVRKPTGVVERLVGHPVFRMDVSDRISEGRSWQLGVLIAHLLKRQGKLAELNDKADQLLWLTGEVNQALEILPVDHIHQKLEQSQSLFSDCAQEGTPLQIIIAKANQSQLYQSEKKAAYFDLLIAGIDNAIEVEEIIEVKLPEMESASLRTLTNSPYHGAITHDKKPAIRKAVVAFSILISTAFTLWSINTLNQPSLTKATKANTTQTSASNPTTPPISVRLIEIRSPKHSNCAAVRFGSIQPTMNELNSNSSGFYHSNDITSLCGVRLVVASDQESIQVSASISVTQADEKLHRKLNAPLIGTKQYGQKLQWQINFDRTLRRAFSYSWQLKSNNLANIGSLPQAVEHIGNL